MKMGKNVRNVLSSGLVAALVLTGVGFTGGVGVSVADAATKSKSTSVSKKPVTKKAPVKKVVKKPVVKKFDYAKYRKDQTKIVNGYSSTLTHLDNPGNLPTPSYLKDTPYGKDVVAYNASATAYRKSFDKTRREVKSVLTLIKSIDTTKEKAAYEKRVSALKTDTTKLNTDSRKLVSKGQALYKLVTSYEKRQLALFETKFGDVEENLALIDFHDYLDGLERHLDSSTHTKAEIVEIMDQAYDRMLDKHEVSYAVIGAKRGEIYNLIYAGKMDEANVVFKDARNNELTVENAKLDEAYNAIIISYLYKK